MTNLKKNFSLIGAGAVGVAALTLGTAGIAGAQDADESTTTDPAVEETEDSTRAERREARQERRQARIQSVIDDLIADGTITQEQVDAAESVRDILQAQREEAKAEKLQALADAIGISVEDLEAAKSEGASLADIAGDNLDAVVDLFVDNATDRINAAVESGRITQEQADERLDGLEDRITTRLEEGGGFGKRGNKGDRANRGGANNAEVQEATFTA